MAEKVQVTVMAIKVDLDCEKCYKKIKKVLCKIPQIQNQVYDKKANTVIISVVCCSPEKIKKKICCKAGDTVKGIEIKVPDKHKEPAKPNPPAEKPKAPEKTKEKPKEPPKPKEPEKPKEKPKEPEKPKMPEKPKEPEKPKMPEKPKEPEKPKDPPPPQKPKQPEPAPPPMAPVPIPLPKTPEPAPALPVVPMGTCCSECYAGYGGGPCFHGFGRPASPYYETYGHGRPVYDSWGGGGGCGCQRAGYYVCRCEYVCEDDRPGCRIM